MRVCSFCGERNEDWMEICQRCGNSIINANVEYKAVRDKEPINNTLINKIDERKPIANLDLIIVIIVLSIILIGLLIYIINTI